MTSGGVSDLAGVQRALEAATSADLRPGLQTRVADLAAVDVPPCDLVNASLSLPFLPPESFWDAWARIIAALPVGGRLAAMLSATATGMSAIRL